MKELYKGKTKKVYSISKKKILLKFRNTVLGTDGVPDPGGNQIIGYKKGKALSAMLLSEYFFKLLTDNGIRNHYIKTDSRQMAILVEKTEIFGSGLEFICRLRAAGSFMKRFSEYTVYMQDLKYLIEISIKDDAKNDPFISDEALLKLGIISIKALKKAKNLTKKVARVIHKDITGKGLDLVDIKVEFGVLNDEITVIDTMNSDNMRVFDKNGRYIANRELLNRLLNNSR